MAAVPRAIAVPSPGPGWELALDRAEQLGSVAIRVPFPWREHAEGTFDDWARALDACHDRDLTPIVDLGANDAPASLGPAPWRRTTTVDEFAAWVDTAIERLSGRCRHWVTMPSPVRFAVDCWLAGVASVGRRIDVAAAIRAMDNLGAAHVLAYDRIHARQPQAVVGLGHHPFAVYELDGLLLDILSARASGIARYDLSPWLASRRGRMPAAGTMAHRVARRWARNAIPMEKAFPRTIAAVYDGDGDRRLDALHIEAGHRSPLHHLRQGPDDSPGAAADTATMYRAACTARDTATPVWIVAGACAGLTLAGAQLAATELARDAVDVAGIIVAESG